MLGIHLSARGDFLTANGKKYYFLETTYPNWNIGDIPPEFNNTRFWFIDEIDSPESQKELIKKFQDDNSRRNNKPTPAKPE
jgi:hypothetical protein